MEPGQLLHSLLSQAAPVTALVGARIHALRLPQNAPRPAIAYQVVSDADDSGPLCRLNETPRVQVSLYADTYPLLCALARAVRAVLGEYRAGQVSIDYENGADQYEDGAACFMRTQDYVFDFPPYEVAQVAAATTTLTATTFTAA